MILWSWQRGDGQNRPSCLQVSAPMSSNICDDVHAILGWRWQSLGDVQLPPPSLLVQAACAAGCWQLLLLPQVRVQFFLISFNTWWWWNQPWRHQIQQLYVRPAAVMQVSSCSIFFWLVVPTSLNFKHVRRLCVSQVETGQGELKTTRAHLPPQAYHTMYTLAPLTLIILFTKKQFRKPKEIKKQ